MVGIKNSVALTTLLGLLLTFRPAVAQVGAPAAGPTSEPVAFYVEQPTDGSVPCPVCRAQAARTGCQHCLVIPVVTPGAMWLVDPKTYILPSDFGWSYPIKRAIIRRNLTYQRYWPAQWTGERTKAAVSSYPMVAQPTDTMQLGYYYQHVPTWQPRPDMLPRPPLPSKWHIRKCGHLPDGSYVVWVPLSSMPVQAAPAESSERPEQQPAESQSPAQPQQPAEPQQDQAPPSPPPAPASTAQVRVRSMLR